jgi:hypothetical protein
MNEKGLFSRFSIIFLIFGAEERAESREQRAESREQRAENREQR